MKKKAAFFNNGTEWIGTCPIEYVYAQGRREELEDLTDMYGTIISTENFGDHVDNLQDLEVIFSTWGMPELTEVQLKRLPSLKAVFYAAGSPNTFKDPILEKGITLVSSWKANGIPVAEFCVAQIILACTGYFRNTVACKNLETMAISAKSTIGRGVYGATVVLIGAGTICMKTRDLLKPFNLNVIVIPSKKDLRTISLEEAFEKAYVVSNHLPDRDDNIGDLYGDLFKSMPEGATFINTGRGRQVNESELIEVLKDRKDLTALLDVQYPEPPEQDSELYTLPNVQLTSHIAGSKNDEVVRMADFAIEEFKRWSAGEILLYEVTKDMVFA